VASATAVFEAAQAGDAAAALEQLGAFRILCAHRRGPDGVSRWIDTIESWLTAAVPGFATASRWYVGRPLLVTQNDYELQLSNGDTGVIVQRDDGRLVAAFERGGGTVTFSPTRLGPVETVYAMTVHKGQGSQFHTAAVLLPAPESRILTRELLYTAVTRAQEELIVVGTEETVRAAVDRPIARASGLAARLSPEPASPTSQVV
jgi:exodeoxyribonuclease V alpha subunit